MRTSIAIPVLLGAGAIAHPHFKLNNPLAHVHHKRNAPAEIITTTIGGQAVVEDIFVDYVTGVPPPPTTTTPVPVVTTTLVPQVAAPERVVAPVQQKQQQNKAPAKQQQNIIPTTAAPAPSVTPTVTPPAPAPVSSSPPQAPSSGGNDGAPTSGGTSILETANKYRALMGFNPFTYSSQLDGNAAKTNNDDGANKMTHELNSGSFAQCIAQVDNNTGADGLSPFELTYLGWLCEISDSRISTVCGQMQSATNMQNPSGDTGHAEILRTASYTKMGCNYLTSTEQHANFAGMWTCDFA